MRRDNYPLNGAKRFETLPQCLEYMKTNYDGQTALTFFDEDGEAEEWTFGQFASDVDACMEGLCASGLTGTHMALISENCYEWVVAFFAVVCSGGTAVPIDVEQTAEEIQKAVRHADCGAMIISETYELILNAQKIPESRFVIRRDGGTDSFDALLSLSRSFFADSSYMLSFSVLCSCVCSRLISPSVSSWHKQDNTLMHQSPGHIQRRTPYNF